MLVVFLVTVVDAGGISGDGGGLRRNTLIFAGILLPTLRSLL